MIASLDRFFWFIRERDRIRRKRERREPFPWTDDPILSKYRFTNIYRMDDRVSKHWLRTVHDHYLPYRKDYAEPLVRETMIYRTFVHPDTFELLEDELEEWDWKRAAKTLGRIHAKGVPYHTNAYTISACGSKNPKHLTLCANLAMALEHVSSIVQVIRETRSIEQTVKYMDHHADGFSMFTAYEVATDLRHTALLSKAVDIHTWANPGPGCQLGLHLLHGRPLTKTNKPSAAQEEQYVAEMRELLVESQRPGRLGKWMAPFEMRDIENCLCEFSKYERCRLGLSRPRNRFVPPEQRRAA